MDKVTWIHISDLHLRTSYDADIVLNKLLEDIPKFIKENSLDVNFIIVSGDVSYSSKPEEYEIAANFLDRLLKISNLDKKDLFLVPGNHDVDRTAITPGAQAISDGLKDRDAINKLLANDYDRAFILRRFHTYSDFIKKYMNGNITFNDNEYYYVKDISIDKIKISVLGLNSSWLSASDEDQGRLALGEMQVRKAIEKADADIHSNASSS
jgi:DNA repair exonuclease SbcCD nuclease subunit